MNCNPLELLPNPVDLPVVACSASRAGTNREFAGWQTILGYRFFSVGTLSWKCAFEGSLR